MLAQKAALARKKTSFIVASPKAGVLVAVGYAGSPDDLVELRASIDGLLRTYFPNDAPAVGEAAPPVERRPLVQPRRQPVVMRGREHLDTSDEDLDRELFRR